MLLRFITLILFSLTVNVSFAQKTLLVFGDSITAGLGVEQEQAFPAHLQAKFDSAGYDINVINGGLSGETSAGGLRRIDWILQRPVDIMILELGGNDGLRGIDLSSTKQNLQGIIDKALKKNPDMQIILAGMQVPPNLGVDYTREFQSLYPDLAEENDLPLIPTIMEPVGGNDKLMQPDQIHPNARGHQVIAKYMWDYLQEMIPK